MPDRVRIVEVGPRDGLQNEVRTLSAGERVEFVERLLAAGCEAVEVGSFVSPRWVPQMAGTDRVLQTLGHRPGRRLPVLVPNGKGLDAALAAGAREIAVFAAASETFSRRNINCSIAESMTRFGPVVERARASGIEVRGYVSCVLGCPYEGAVGPERVAEVARRLHELGCYEVSLGDTIGVGTPGHARDLIRTAAREMPVERIGIHFHDTWGQALANIHACLEEGVRTVDAAAGGLGGCPYAEGASGNVATEDVVYMLDGLGMPTGIDLARLAEASRHVLDLLGRETLSKAARAVTSRTDRPKAAA